MAPTIDWIELHWLCLALTTSTFWGLRSVFLFTHDPSAQPSPYLLRSRSRRLSIFFSASLEFILNAVGSLFAWGCFAVLLARLQVNQSPPPSLGAGDFTLFILSLIGLTGHLPQVMVGLVESFGKLAQGILERIAGSSKP